MPRHTNHGRLSARVNSNVDTRTNAHVVTRDQENHRSYRCTRIQTHTCTTSRGMSRVQVRSPRETHVRTPQDKRLLIRTESQTNPPSYQHWLLAVSKLSKQRSKRGTAAKCSQRWRERRPAKWSQFSSGGSQQRGEKTRHVQRVQVGACLCACLCPCFRQTCMRA
jgi:hypothetical protein